MARLVVSDGYSRALMGGFTTADTVRQRKEQDLNRFRDNVVRTRGDDYLERFDNRTRKLDLDILESRSLAINRHSRSAFRDDMIMDMDTVGDLQHASALNRRYLLTDTRINFYARNQRIEAWGEPIDNYAYTNDDDKHDNPYYRAMNHGMMQVSSNGADMYVENYLCHQEDPNDPKLSYTEQRSLYRSRDILLAILGEGNEDPTSKMNNLL